ncbi:hypothetical protein BT93_D1958 [Corymbia citriodora subsp. variegata]|nr:hypothetical protein BT93_D1958 [Corymbia citriodora subsp. variegata]
MTPVETINNLLVGTTLTAHCKSKNDDLRIQHITRSWGFSFEPSIPGRTLFFCSFAWSGQIQWFDIYVQGRDQNFCTQCKWKISPNDPCMLN